VTLRLQKSDLALTPLDGLEKKLATAGIRVHITMKKRYCSFVADT
jgi:hypothetical protein